MSNSLSKSLISKLNSPLDEANIYNPQILIDKTQGIYAWANGDNVPYIDLVMGYSSTNFGHVNKRLLAVVSDAIKKFDNLTSFNSKAKIELSNKLIELLPFPDDKLTYFPVGGTKAIDAAIKLARAFTKKRK